MIWFDLIWFDLIWFDLIWFDLIWFDLIWFDLIWFDLIWFDECRWYMTKYEEEEWKKNNEYEYIFYYPISPIYYRLFEDLLQSILCIVQFNRKNQERRKNDEYLLGLWKSIWNIHPLNEWSSFAYFQIIYW